MYLHQAVLHYDWWLVNITGLLLYDVLLPALWKSVSLELCAFFNKSLLQTVLLEKNFIWIHLRTEHLSDIEQADSNRVFSVRILHDESIFLLPQLPTSYTQSGWSTQVALCSRGVEHLTRLPASTALQQVNAKCLSQTVQGCWQIITRTVAENFQALNLSSLSPQTGCSSRPITSPPLETWIEIVAPEIKPVTCLITRSRCHPVKSIVWVFGAFGGLFG